MLDLFFGRRTKVLVVNGSRREAGQVADCLPAAEFEVIKAETGRTGLRAAIKEIPELIILDSELPANNGWETLADLKNNVKTSSIPVLMCTPAGEPGGCERAYAGGAQGCIPKPLKKDVVITRVTRRLNRPDWNHNAPYSRKGSF